ncbi:MAG TPA: tryptophan synthase subunit alpha [Clostridiales bacterium]|nr:tryptophan synthase subunit alpha [Clostridiales bacterium]
MNKLKQVFAKGKAFIPFITAGDPSLEITEQLVLQMADAGADLIELGIPFSDPVAEGPVVQEADNRALLGGTTTDKIFSMMARIRKSCNIPVAFMTYMNPIFTYGTDRFMKNCQQVGVDAVIVPDVPYEEKDELMPFCSKYNVSLISMIAQASSNRIHMIASEAQGFMYCASSMGVTGAPQDINSDVKGMIKLVKEVRNIPCVICFDIYTPEQAAKIAEFSDGVIVENAIVKIVEQYGVDCIPYVVEYVKRMIPALK